MGIHKRKSARSAIFPPAMRFISSLSTWSFLLFFLAFFTKLPAASEEDSASFRLVDHFITRGKFPQAVETLRSLLQTNLPQKEEQKATFLLGKTFLLDQQHELASATFEYLMETWPSNPYQTRVDFLEIDQELSTMTHLGSFEKSAAKILNFPPFNLDPDFFRYFSGYTKGYFFSDYARIKPRLAPYLQSPDPDLKARAQLLTGLVEGYDFQNRDAGLQYLKEVQNSSNQYLAHTASLALFIQECSQNLDDPRALESLIPRNWNESEPGVLTMTLHAMVLAYIHGEFQSAMGHFRRVFEYATDSMRSRIQEHLKVLKTITTPSKNPASLLEKARVFEQYSSYHQALGLYRKAIQSTSKKGIQARCFYEIGRILQDDLQDVEGALLSFERALELRLPEELGQEIHWRKLKALPKEKRLEAMQQYSHNQLPYTEAAILEQMKSNAADSRFLDRYFQSLLELGLEPRSQQQILDSLIQLALSSRQFFKARYFLMKMARFDLVGTSRLLKEVDLKEKIHQAEHSMLTSMEPDKFRYLQGTYLMELGEKNRAREILEQVAKNKGLYSHKAQFYLFEQELGALPHPADTLALLEDYFRQDPDPWIQNRAFEHLRKHFQFLFQDLSLLEEDQKKEHLNHDFPRYLKILKQGLEAFPEKGEELRMELAAVLIQQGKLDEAREFVDWLVRFASPESSLQIQFRWAEADLDPQASNLSQELSELFQENPKKSAAWLQKAYEIEKNQLLSLEQSANDKSSIKNQTSLLSRYLSRNPVLFSGLFSREFLSLSALSPQDPSLLTLFEKNRVPLTRELKTGLSPYLETILTTQPDHPSILASKLEILALHPLSADGLAFALEQIHHSSKIVRKAALLCLSRASNLQVLSKQFSEDSFLARSLTKTLRHPDDLIQEEIHDLFELKWSLSGEAARQSLRKNWMSLPHGEAQIISRKLMGEVLARGEISEGIKLLSKSFQAGLDPNHLYLLFQKLFDSLKDGGEISRLKPFLFKIATGQLDPENALKFKKLGREINARSVLAALSKNVDWDDPQGSKNISIFFQMVDVAWKELHDIPAASNLLTQMRQYFSDPDTAGKINTLMDKLPLLHQAFRLEEEGTANSLEMAGSLWLEELDDPERAVELFKRAMERKEDSPSQTFLKLQQARAFIQMMRFPMAQEILSSLPQEHSALTLPLLRRIEGSAALRNLPDPNRSDLSELLNRGRILLTQLQDFPAYQRISQSLFNRWKKAGYPRAMGEEIGQLFLQAYDSAMSKNEEELALKNLKIVLQSSFPDVLRSRAYYLAGTHFSSYQPKPGLAQTYFLKGSQISGGKQYQLLNLVGLVRVLEETNKPARALEVLGRIKSIIQETNENPALENIEEQELAISKGLVYSKIDSYLAELDQPEPTIVLKSARALRKRAEYVDEAEKKYLLYLRLEGDGTKRETARFELAELYAENSRLSEAVEEFLRVAHGTDSPKRKFQSTIQAIILTGLKMRNFQRALELVSNLKKSILDPTQVQELQKITEEIRTRQSQQKKLKLSTLSFNHFPAIRSIKESFYKIRNYKEAARRLEKLNRQTEDFPLQTGIHYELGRLYDLKLKDFIKALEHYKEFLERFQHDEISPEVLLRVAEIQLKELEAPAKALFSYQRYLETFPFARKRLAVLFQVGELLIQHKRDYSSALDTYADISRAYPQTEWDERAKFAKANLLSRYLSDFVGAIEAYEDLVEKNFQSALAPEAQFRVGRIYEIQLNDKLRAIDSYQRVIDRFPGSPFSTQARDQLEKIRRR